MCPHPGMRPLKIVGWVIVGLLAASAIALVLGFVIQALWNWLLPPLFHLPAITYWQAFGLTLLARLLFGSLGGHHPGKHHHPGRHAQDWHDRLHHAEDWHEQGGRWRNWRAYDAWWQGEGKRAFADFLAKKTEGGDSE